MDVTILRVRGTRREVLAWCGWGVAEKYRELRWTRINQPDDRAYGEYSGKYMMALMDRGGLIFCFTRSSYSTWSLRLKTVTLDDAHRSWSVAKHILKYPANAPQWFPLRTPDHSPRRRRGIDTSSQQRYISPRNNSLLSNLSCAIETRLLFTTTRCANKRRGGFITQIHLQHVPKCTLPRSTCQ